MDNYIKSMFGRIFKLFQDRYAHKSIILAVDSIASIVASLAAFAIVSWALKIDMNPNIYLYLTLFSAVSSIISIVSFRTYAVAVRHTTIVEVGALIGVTIFKAAIMLVFLFALSSSGTYKTPFLNLFLVEILDVLFTLIFLIIIRTLVSTIYKMMLKKVSEDKAQRILVYGDNDGVQQTESMGVFVGTSTKPTKQLVNWEGDLESGVHSYSPLQEWQTSLKYAFFAWYPENLEPNDGKDTDNNLNEFYVGKPFITYELNTGSNKESRQKMIDVMTACRTDYIRSISGPSVSLTMKHRLAALDIKAMSVVDAKSLKKYLNENGQSDEASSIADNSVVTVRFSNLKLKLNSIKSGAKIPLNTEPDDNNEIEPIEPLKNGNGTDKTFVPEYYGFDCNVPVPYYNDEDDIIDLVGDDEKLILIPQTEEITATLSFTYDLLCDGNKINFASGSYPPTGAGSNSDIPIYGLEEGKYHYLLITVAKSGISVKVVVEGDNWEGKDDYIDHEFN